MNGNGHSKVPPEAVGWSAESRSGRPIDWSLVHACAVVRLVFVLARAGTRQRTWVEWCQRRLARLGNAVPAVRGPT